MAGTSTPAMAQVTLFASHGKDPAYLGWLLLMDYSSCLDVQPRSKISYGFASTTTLASAARRLLGLTRSLVVKKLVL